MRKRPAWPIRCEPWRLADGGGWLATASRRLCLGALRCGIAAGSREELSPRRLAVAKRSPVPNRKPNMFPIGSHPLIVPREPQARLKYERSERSHRKQICRLRASRNKGSVSKVRPSSRSHRRVNCITPRSNASRPRRRRQLKTDPRCCKASCFF